MVTRCYGLHICIPQNSYAEALAPNAVVVGGGILRGQLDLDEMVRIEPP